MIIRRERKEEFRVVEELIRDAFWNVHEPGAAEHYIAHRLRGHKDFVKELDMVAEVDGKIAGSIMYTAAHLTCEDGRRGKCLTFGPLAVHPKFQRKGIGKTLHVFDGKRWTYTESDAYEFDPKEVEAYDRFFPFKEKKVLPSQEEFYIFSHSRIFDDTEQ